MFADFERGCTYSRKTLMNETQDLLRIPPRLLPSHLCLKSPFHIADKVGACSNLYVNAGSQGMENPNFNN